MNSSSLQNTIKLQQQASNPKNSAWVFASAGSGKTKILTDRVLRLLLNGVLPHKILCLTFTKVAATEMQNRINKELASWVLLDDDELRNKLSNLSGKSPSEKNLTEARSLFLKILDSESKIKIQTIHSFCQSIIKIFPFEAKITPNFEILESNNEKILLKEAQKDVIRKARNNEFYENLIEEISIKINDESFLEIISDLLSKKEEILFLKESFFGIENLIDEIFKNFAIPQNEDEDKIFEQFIEKINKKEVLNLATSLENSSSSKNIDISQKIQKFFSNQKTDNFHNYKLAFFTKEDSPRKIYGSEAKDERLLKIIDEQKALIINFNEKLNSLRICNDTAIILRFIDQILESYSNKKKQDSFLDYNDLIVETNKLLMNPDFSNWVKMKMDGSFDHILVDESQDTNHQQWNIIKALSEDFFSGIGAGDDNRSIFIVGDEKQSIYSFQGAEANISKEIYSYFYEASNEKLQKIELNNSFRSGSEVLNLVDKVFSDQKRKDAISKTSEFKNHNPIRNTKGKVEVWPQIVPEKKEKKEQSYEWKFDFLESNEEQKEQEILAEAIAKKIANGVNKKIKLENRQESLKFGDFMILLRNRTNGFDKSLAKYFNKYNIAFSSQSRVKFGENLLILDLLSSAKFALLTEDDLNLACLLKSPIFNLTEADLLNICLFKNDNKTSIYQSLDKLDKYKNVKEKLDKIITKSKTLDCFEFFYSLLNKENHQKDFLAYFGNENLEIIEKFLSFVRDFSKNNSPSLQKLIEFIDNLNPELSLSSEDRNKVKITTIHSAKGLQAPIVIMPDCSYNFNQLLGAKEKISWVDFGNFNLPIWCNKKSQENSIIKSHKEKRIKEAKDEYLRLLYVALTRAEDELYIAGFGNSKDPECWYEVVKNSAPELSQPLPEADIVINELKEESFKEIKLEQLKTAPKEFFEEDDVEDQINISKIKGKLIHKILEIFGKSGSQNKEWLFKIAKNLIHEKEILDESLKSDLLKSIKNFLDSKVFDEIFSNNIKCEIDIASNNKLYRIDALIEKDEEVLIIDYKSDEEKPDKIPNQYQEQLLNYKSALEKIYPKKPVRCAILWIKSMEMQFLEQKNKEQKQLNLF